MPNSWKDVIQGNEDIGRRDTLKVAAGGAAGTALAVDAVDDNDNMYTRIAGALNSVYQGVFVDPVADEIEERQASQGGGSDEGSSVDNEDSVDDDVSGEDGNDDFSYNFGDLPYDSIADGLAYQSDSAIDAFDDEIVQAFFNRDEDSQEVVDDAYIDVEDSTTREYLEASSDEREDIDVFLGFKNGNEGTKLRGSSSAGMNEDFEEYMVGLNHLGRFDNEMEEYMQEVEDMLD